MLFRSFLPLSDSFILSPAFISLTQEKREKQEKPKKQIRSKKFPLLYSLLSSLISLTLISLSHRLSHSLSHYLLLYHYLRTQIISPLPLSLTCCQELPYFFPITNSPPPLFVDRLKGSPSSRPLIPSPAPSLNIYYHHTSTESVTLFI